MPHDIEVPLEAIIGEKQLAPVFLDSSHPTPPISGIVARLETVLTKTTGEIYFQRSDLFIQTDEEPGKEPFPHGYAPGPHWVRGENGEFQKLEGRRMWAWAHEIN